MRGSLGSEAEGSGNELRGRKLEFRKASRVDIRDGGNDDKPKGARADSQGRAESAEAEAGPSKGHIGKRQRREDTLESCRESIREKGGIIIIWIFFQAPQAIKANIRIFL